MPTTRSKGRNEPLQRLQTPPKRQRKLRSKKSIMTQIHAQVYPQDPPFRTLSLSPEPKVQTQDASTQVSLSTYVDASTQTDEVVVLTQTELAELRDRASTAMSHKRSRDDESEEEPTAKRQQFSTPQTKPNTLWMFGGKLNGDHPRTAPSKTLSASSIRRPIRGPLSRRTDRSGSPQRRAAPSTISQNENIRPIEKAPEASSEEIFDEQDVVDPTQETQKVHETQEIQEVHGSQDLEEPQPQSIARPTAVPRTPRRGIFGSLRGMVHKGWDIATSFSPISAREATNTTEPHTSSLNAVAYPQLQPSVEDAESQAGRNMNADSYNYIAQPRDGTPESVERHRPKAPDHSGRSNLYDHLHYVPADDESIARAASGDLEPPQPTKPLSPRSRIRAQNPGLSEEMIESMAKKKERRAILDEAHFGAQLAPGEAKVAPLFGPDSHYARGTVDPRFLPPTPIFGLRKRKLDSGEDETKYNNTTTSGKEFVDHDADATDLDRDTLERDLFQSPTKKARINDLGPSTPRSALKKPGNMGSIGRKSVTFGDSMSRDIRSHYGPAGQYKGSTFADSSPTDDSLMSIDHTDIISPNTQLNTFANTGKRPSVFDNLGADVPHIDFTLRDPNDANWRPSLGNPRPGSFRVPDIDEEDPDESMLDDDTPEQPQTPRMSHAELPNAPNSVTSTAFNDSSIVHESTELALDKARLKAEKYKPKSSSRLSEVAQALSRSPSPDDEDENGERVSRSSLRQTARGTTLATDSTIQGFTPRIPRELDNTNKGEDGMTDYEREHQYDDWAASLQWDAPQTYEDAGTGSPFIHNLIRKNWSQEDDRRSEEFWANEFDSVDRAMEDAKRMGHRLNLLTGLEDMDYEKTGDMLMSPPSVQVS